MSELGQSSPPQRLYCIDCNQFFGSPETENRCSACFKAYQQRQKTENEVLELATKIQEQSPNEEAKSPPQENPNRCMQCNRRLGLMPFACKCGYNFCAKHRLPLDHLCLYDFHKDAQRKLSENLPEVKPDKISKV